MSLGFSLESSSYPSPREGHVPGSEGLQDHVRRRYQSLEQVLALSGLQAEGNAPLGGVVMPEKEAALTMGGVLQERPHGPGVVPAGRLYLDDLGAQVGHELAAEVALLVGQLQDSNTRHGAGEGWVGQWAIGHPRAS